jgi:IS30 family transposase
LQAAFIGRDRPHRSHRTWVNGWSPEQIASRLQADFPDDYSMRISHEAIYQALYIQGRGALKRERVSYLRMACFARATGQGVGCHSASEKANGSD